MEIFAAFHEYLKLVDAYVLPSIHLLLTEYCKYTTDGKVCAYPCFLPEDAISEEPKNGHIDRNLAIPLEDIYQGWEKAGQEVYGAGAAPAIVTRCYHHIDGALFYIVSIPYMTFALITMGLPESSRCAATADCAV